MEKIIFLDVDGVLNSQDYYEKNIEEIKKKKKEPENMIEYLSQDIDPECVDRLQKIIDATGAKVVLSSTWRLCHYEDLKIILKNFNCTAEIIDKTPRGGKNCVRGNEIRMWMQENEEVIGCPEHKYTNYVIIDDDSDMLYWQKDHFAQTSWKSGLQDETMYKAIAILNKE